MACEIVIEEQRPFEEGVAQGKELGRAALRQQVRQLLQGEHVRGNLGAMSRQALEHYVLSRLETVPDYGRYPELEDLYPEKLEQIRGLAQGAGCSLVEAALWSYLQFRKEIDYWSHIYDVTPEVLMAGSGPGCSGVLMVGPDGVIGAQNCDSGPPPKPRGYRHRAPRPFAKWSASKPTVAAKLVLTKPRTGYIERWGVTNEKGVACLAGTSCGTLLDEPIEDIWPIGQVPLLRFARDIGHLAELFQRYTLHNWNRSNMVWGDTAGGGMIVEKSNRRIGIELIGPSQVIWCTEGHRQHSEMAAFMREKRLEFLARSGRHLGFGDMQYATDSAVRYTRLGELCHENLGRDLKHLNRVMTDHATFPRATCRHGGPDSAPYDCTVTMAQSMANLTTNTQYGRNWLPWKKFPCEMPWQATRYPARP